MSRKPVKFKKIGKKRLISKNFTKSIARFEKMMGGKLQI